MNELVIHVQPDEAIYLQINDKFPNLGMRLEPSPALRYPIPISLIVYFVDHLPMLEILEACVVK
jgi:hypothetical protein